MADDNYNVQGNIKDKSISSNLIADNAINANHIVNGAIDNSKLAGNAVTSLKIAPQGVTGANLADGAVDARTIANMAVTNDKIADGTIQLSKLAGFNWLEVADPNKPTDALNRLIQKGGGLLVLPNGTYKIADNLVIPDNVSLKFMNGARLQVASGKKVTIIGSVEASLTQIFTGDGIIDGTMKVPYVPAQWFGAKGDGATDDTDALERTMQYLERTKGGVLFLPSGTYVLRYLKLRARVSIEGEGNSTILKLKDRTNGNLIYFNDNTVLQFRIANLFIDGNKANNTAGSGIYLNKTAYVRPDYVTVTTNAGDLNSQIQNVCINNCAEHGIFMDSVGSTGTAFINIRAVHITELQVTNCGKSGLKLYKASDCKFTNCICSGNALSGFDLDSASNNFYVDTKTYYNAANAPLGVGGGFSIVNCGRSAFIGCEAQEEYRHGFYVDNSNMLMFSSCSADSNGQANSTYSGYYFKAVQQTNMMGCISTSFHYPSWQGIGITLENCKGCNLLMSIKNQLSKNYEFKGTNSGINMWVDGENVVTSDQVQLTSKDNPQLTSTLRQTGDAHEIHLDFDSSSTDPTANYQYRFFPRAATSGWLQMLMFDGGGNVSHKLSGKGSSYLSMGSNDMLSLGSQTPTEKLQVAGSIRIDGGYIVFGKYRMWIDSTGVLRIKDGKPSGDRDGIVVGTQQG